MLCKTLFCMLSISVASCLSREPDCEPYEACIYKHGGPDVVDLVHKVAHVGRKAPHNLGQAAVASYLLDEGDRLPMVPRIASTTPIRCRGLICTCPCPLLLRTTRRDGGDTASSAAPSSPTGAEEALRHGRTTCV